MDIFRIADARHFSPERTTRLSLLDRPRLVADLLCLEPGQDLELRENTVSDELYLVIEGNAVISVGMQHNELHLNEGVLVPPGVKHSIRNPGPDRLTVLMLVAPKPTRSAEVFTPGVEPPRRRMFPGQAGRRFEREAPRPPARLPQRPVGSPPLRSTYDEPPAPASDEDLPQSEMLRPLPGAANEAGGAAPEASPIRDEESQPPPRALPRGLPQLPGRSPAASRLIARRGLAPRPPRADDGNRDRGPERRPARAAPPPPEGRPFPPRGGPPRGEPGGERGRQPFAGGRAGPAPSRDRRNFDDRPPRGGDRPPPFRGEGSRGGPPRPAGNQNFGDRRGPSPRPGGPDRGPGRSRPATGRPAQGFRSGPPSRGPVRPPPFGGRGDARPPIGERRNEGPARGRPPGPGGEQRERNVNPSRGWVGKRPPAGTAPPFATNRRPAGGGQGPRTGGGGRPGSTPGRGGGRDQGGDKDNRETRGQRPPGGPQRGGGSGGARRPPTGGRNGPQGPGRSGPRTSRPR